DRAFINGMTLTFSPDRLSTENVKKHKDVQVLSVFIFSRIDKAILDQLPNLKHINTMSTGFDHIDLKECAKRAITVSNVPSYGENTVAEHAFALLLCLSRKVLPSIERTRKGNFETGPALRGFDLRGKTIGVIGTGRIGRNAIKYAKGFDMNVIAFDAMPNVQAAKDLGFTYEKDLASLLAKSDVITLHAPDLPTTHHMINLGNVDTIKIGCVLINTARGGLIETEAILRGLDGGIFSGVGLDVLEEETGIKEEKQLLARNYEKVNLKTLIQQHTLLEYDNVIITPHNAFNSAEALQRILDTSVENVSAYFKHAPTNLVKAP
ncbi:MAG: NAD(P)-dependent oxidoreductase, partial [Nanoarchaeota archaeon]